MRRLVAPAAVLATALVLAGCGDAEEAPDAQGGATTETIEITFESGTVTPNGERVELAQGTDVELVVEADAPGELHVHTSTEQELSYAAGTTTLQLSLDNEPPGVVDVESHDLEQVVVQLEIS